MTLYETYRSWTATNIFVVPTLGIQRQKLLDVGLLNAYIKDEMREYEGVVYLLFAPKNMERFEEFLGEERKKNKVIDEYDYPGGLVMVVFKYPEKIKEDVELIMQGKFSKTSSTYKNMILKSYTITTMGRQREEITIQHQIFSKSQSIMDYWYDILGLTFEKDSEVWEIYTEKEIFNENTLKQWRTYSPNILSS